MFENLKKESAGKIHFIGIGGIGMSALALLLKKTGFAVQGSDLSENAMTGTLRDAKIDYFVGHEAKNIDNEVGLVVKTSIIKESNPEIIAAKEKNLRIITRAQLLAQIMTQKSGVTVAGTHGKTSTTALVAMILEESGLDPLVINGGIIKHFNSNYKLGDGDFLVAESDESDGSFVDLPTKIGVVTNIEPEHLEFYDGDFEKVKGCYEKYMDQIPETGFCAVCIDDLEARKLYEKFATRKNFLSYSISNEADLAAQNIASKADGSSFDAIFKSGRKIKDVKLSAFGAHNISNSLAAIAIADFLGIKDEAIKKALENFSGVKRRFNKIGEIGGAAVIDDYAHHPTEIKAALDSARQFANGKKVTLVLEPHKYTRVHDLFDEFCVCVKDADVVILTKIYSANQDPIDGVSQDSLFEGVKKAGHQNVFKLENEGDLKRLVKENSENGDVILCAGAGKISQMAQDLVQQKPHKIK